MHEEQRRHATRIEDMLLAGLGGPTQDLLLQLLLYKGPFMGAPFRALADREEPAEVRELLMRLHAESGAEAAGLALAMREWDQHPSSPAAIAEYAEEVRRRFLLDILATKDSVVDLGVGAAMRAPTQDLRQRFMALADVDRRHADALRQLLGARTTEQHLQAPDAPREGTLGAGSGRDGNSTFSSAIRRTIDGLLRAGSPPAAIVVSADGLRHLRDEGVVDEATGRAFGLLLELDMGWRGECFAVETIERVGYAELISRRKAAGDPA